MTKKFRFMTGLLAVVLAFVMLSSVAYIAAESDHECTGVDCAICHQINVCENLLKSIELAGSAAATVAAIYIFCAGSFPPVQRLPVPLRWFLSRSNFQIKNKNFLQGCSLSVFG